MHCDLELQVWRQEVAQHILTVRKRLVQELTQSGTGTEENPLQVVVSQQTAELEELRQKVQAQEATIATQGESRA